MEPLSLTEQANRIHLYSIFTGFPQRGGWSALEDGKRYGLIALVCYGVQYHVVTWIPCP